GDRLVKRKGLSGKPPQAEVVWQRTKNARLALVRTSRVFWVASSPPLPVRWGRQRCRWAGGGRFHGNWGPDREAGRSDRDCPAHGLLWQPRPLLRRASPGREVPDVRLPRGTRQRWG